MAGSVWKYCRNEPNNEELFKFKSSSQIILEMQVYGM